MKNRIITAAAFAACLALCAAVWPQNQPAETPVLPTPAVVIAAQPEVSKMPETEEIISPEEEKAEAILPELIEETDIAPEPLPAQMPPASEVQAPPLNTGCNTQEPKPAPVPDSAPDNIVYVLSFGWIESQGLNHAKYAEDMYENGNKIGIMG